MSIPTSLLAAPGESMPWMQWMRWLTTTNDAPIVVLLGLVLLSCGLGVWWRRRDPTP